MEEQYFIRHITVNQVRLIKNFAIPLDQNKRKHLIITGKNGSGKTSVLQQINKNISSLNAKEYSLLGRREQVLRDYILEDRRLQRKIGELQKVLSTKEQKLQFVVHDDKGKEVFQKSVDLDFVWTKYEQEIGELKERRLRVQQRIEMARQRIDRFSTVRIDFSNPDTLIDRIENEDFVYVFFEARRSGGMSGDIRFRQDIDRITKYRQFADYISSLKIEYLFEKEKNNHKRTREIQAWFNKFEEFLRNIFKRKDLKLIFKFSDQKMQCFISYNNQEFDFNQLSDGYSALLMIVAELIMQMSGKGMRISYDMQGVVLIDEVETHLHIALQKEVMPYLCELFPNIQFIVTTHSPFVLSSLENAVVCDLEKKIITEDLSACPYDALIEGYFDNDQYSNSIKEKIDIYERLLDVKTRTKHQEEEMKKIKKYLFNISVSNAPELEAKISELRLKEKLVDMRRERE